MPRGAIKPTTGDFLFCRSPRPQEFTSDFKTILDLTGPESHAVVGGMHCKEGVGKFREAYHKNPKGRFKATLKAEPENIHDRNAVAIYWHNEKVGYLLRKQALKWQSWLIDIADKGYAPRAPLTIAGGEERDLDLETFALRMRLQLNQNKLSEEIAAPSNNNLELG